MKTKKCRECGKRVDVYSDDKKKLCDWCDDIPSIWSDTDYASNSATGGLSIREWEKRNGRGFWGNSTTGYIYDKDLEKI